MALDLEEQEKLAQLRYFWKRYGNWLLALISAVLFSYAGWKFWDNWQYSQAGKVALLYDTFQASLQKDDPALISRSLHDLQSQFPKFILTTHASLWAAKKWYPDNKPESIKSLTWVIENDVDHALSTLARLRLSAIYIEDQQLPMAKSLLQIKSPPIGLKYLLEDRLGDLSLAENNVEEAVKYYQNAWKNAPETQQYREFISAKLASLGKSTSE